MNQDTGTKFEKFNIGNAPIPVGIYSFLVTKIFHVLLQNSPNFVVNQVDAFTVRWTKCIEIDATLRYQRQPPSLKTNLISILAVSWDDPLLRYRGKCSTIGTKLIPKQKKSKP